MEPKISSFHNNVAFFVVAESSDDLIYLYANRYYCEIKNLHHPLQEGQKVSQVISEKNFINFKKNCKNLKGKDYFKYEAYAVINKVNTPITVTLFSCNINKLNLIACSFTFSELYHYEYQQLANTSFNTPQIKTQKTSFAVKESNLSLLITKFNPTLLNYLSLENLENNTDLQDIFPKKVVEFLSEGVSTAISQKKPFKNTLMYECSPYDLTCYNCPENSCFYISVIFVPLYYGPDSCLCLLEDINHKLNIKRFRDELLLEYNTLFNSSINPIAILKVVGHDVIQLEKQNKRMEAFLNCFPHFLPHLYQEHDNFEPIRKNKCRVESMITFDVHEESYQIQMNIDPIIVNNQVNKLIITIMNINSTKNSIDTSTYVYLTKREEEIVSLVVQGQKNDYIASILGITTGTVKKILSNVYKKYSISSRVELMKYYLHE